jgi:hypothetical protein
MQIFLKICLHTCTPDDEFGNNAFYKAKQKLFNMEINEKTRAFDISISFNSRNASTRIIESQEN